MRQRILTTLEAIGPDLRQLKDPHYLIGASAMILAGLPLEKTADIDLLTSEKDATLLKKLWAGKALTTYEPADAQRFRSEFGRYRFGPLDVEVMGELEVFHQGKWGLLKVQEAVPLEGSSLLMPTLAGHLRILEIFDRPKDAERARLISEILNSAS